MKETKYEVKLTGISPIILHRNGMMDDDEEAVAVSGKGSKGKKGDDRTTPDKWKTCLYTDGKNLAFPSVNVNACLLEAGKKLKVGRASLKSESQCLSWDAPDLALLVGGKVVPESDINEIDGNHEEQASLASTLGIEVWPSIIKNPGTGSRNVRVRPRIRDWAVVGTFTIFDDELTRDQLLAIFELAGARIGLGDWRPDPSLKKPGPYGKFTVELTEAKKR